MNRTEVAVQITKIFQDVFDDPDLLLKDETTARDIPGWDSVAMINIIVAIEENFNIRLKTREIEGLKSVGDLYEAVLNKIS
ncbi:acyl carrier protein [Gluconobacter albidus]|uniref:Acyl carrier protein n=1 Tax=Gluconobacter albidus TaxID=318683 RepID=A0AAW3QYU8_9PROT|nr:acyl carrier protein [Gluconobacter albidus]KXV41593.1 acyl carrier protein [Gluconobacter albidus]GBQ89821.1 acyl carrier protein [Gluconobacter albidus NBRC 3250]GLQ69628.1 acyl carrier protein [Gluconobacter albidus]